MSLDGILSVASGGLTDISRRLAVVAQNVSNANTPGYSREVAQDTSVTAGGIGMGVSTGATTRAIDLAMQSDLFSQNGRVAELQTRQSALGQIDAVQGTPGAGGDLGSLLGKLQDGFSSLAADPSSQTQQTQVTVAAGVLTGQINALGAAVTQGRQTAQDAIVGGVAALNTALATIGDLSSRIVRAKAIGQSTADLENQRDVAMGGLSQQVDVKFLQQSSGDLLVVTPTGLNLPIHSMTPPFQTSDATVSPTNAYPGGGLPAVTLQGTDVTRQLAGGQLGANIALRDTTLPTVQANLDEFAQTLSTRFDQQGLTLFTDPTGTVPVGGGTPVQSTYVGYASTIEVNPAVLTTPSLVRDGTRAVTVPNPSGATVFTPNPAGGPAGFTGLVTRVLDYALGTQAQANLAQPAPATTGLGVAGTLASGYSAPADLAGLAGAVVGQQASQSAGATAALGTEQAVRTTLQTKLSSNSTVSIDTEMSTMVQLQNAYSANARVITATQSLWTQLLQIVP